MPKIYDNIEKNLIDGLTSILQHSHKADFCVGYFNLRGWRQVLPSVEHFVGEEGKQCRLLIGMMDTSEKQEVINFFDNNHIPMDTSQVVKLANQLAHELREQLTIGIPSFEDSEALRDLVKQLRKRKLVVKLHTRHKLHAKLYLCYREDATNPITGFVGSSNLTTAGLVRQGELNVDVMDEDACIKLQKWFEDRWNDKFSIDVTQQLIQVIEESWACAEVSPYHIYMKLVYHLSREARAGSYEFPIPSEFKGQLFEFQEKAVQLAAHHIKKRNGVLIGDVVGLGKTIMASAVIKVLQESNNYRALIICPKNLVTMWDKYVHNYNLGAKVISISNLQSELKRLPGRYHLVLIDESHSLRNRKGKRYQLVFEYIRDHESKCILLSATPYNKTYSDLYNQLRLFIPEEKNIGIRPEAYIEKVFGGDVQAFESHHQCSPHSFHAFDKTGEPRDFQELMRLFMVRRTREFIQKNYALEDPKNKRKYLQFPDGTKSYFPDRVPKRVEFKVDEKNPNDPYAKLYSSDIVSIINDLHVPRYGLGNYKKEKFEKQPAKEEAVLLANLSNAGKRLMGFCRTNLLKRLESSGVTFIQSLDRHIFRNYIFLYAIENNLPLPIGTQNAEMLESSFEDKDYDDSKQVLDNNDDDETIEEEKKEQIVTESSNYKEEEYQKKAKVIYEMYRNHYKNYFDWISPIFFKPELKQHLKEDINALLSILKEKGNWSTDKDEKLKALQELVQKKHPKEKILIFTQFADTALYLQNSLVDRGLGQIAYVTGSTDEPTEFAQRFSPKSNAVEIKKEDEIRVLISTDVLSEGQNLQDAHIVVNFDLPWAIIRLIQRAGRVDRIGQTSEKILCYSFFPAKGIEKIIRLRNRIITRLRENAEVVGTDESFFEDDAVSEIVLGDLYNEKSGILDQEGKEEDVDFTSYAYQIWQKAIKENPDLKKEIEQIPNVVYSTKPIDVKNSEIHKQEGVLVFVRTNEGNDCLAYIDKYGNSVTESPIAILKSAECLPLTPALNPLSNHFNLLKTGVERLHEEEKRIGGSLGRKTSVRYKVYERMKAFFQQVKGEYLSRLEKAIDEVYKFPLLETATDQLNKRMKMDISDEELADLIINLKEENRLCDVREDVEFHKPRIICSMGLKKE